MFKKSFEPLKENVKKLREIVSKEIHSSIAKTQADNIFTEINKQLEEIEKHCDCLEQMDDMNSRSGPLDD
jgi:DNA-binding transcriptional regulator GbsR (MarR family)